MKKALFLAFGLVLLASCAHHKDVRPSADGIHRVVITSEDTEKGARAALKQAEHYCDEQGKHAAIVAEDKKYSGDMSEEDYKKGKTIAKVAQAAGGAIGDSALGKGYTVEMKFKCQ